MSGGTSALLVSVLSASSAGDALRRVTVRTATRRSRCPGATGPAPSARRPLQHRADALQQAAEATTVTASDVTRRYDAAHRDPRRGHRSADPAHAEGPHARGGRGGRRPAVGTERGRRRGRPGSGSRRRTPARRCRRTTTRSTSPPPTPVAGMSWALLAAIGQVESGHGANTSTSYAGAQGPMQFLPSTFASYAVDGDHDGDHRHPGPRGRRSSRRRTTCAPTARAATPEATAPRGLALQPRGLVRRAGAQAGRRATTPAPARPPPAEPAPGLVSVHRRASG